MKTKLIIFFLSLSIAKLSAQEVWTDPSRILPDELRNLPTAIMLSHSPTPVYPEVNNDTLNYPGKYIWKHSTTVRTEQPNLTVVKAGSYIWLEKKGWVRNIEMDKEEFSNYFNCKNGQLIKNKNYVFLKNYRHGDQRYAGDALWFVLAKDKDGVIYKGIAIVETEDKLKL